MVVKFKLSDSWILSLVLSLLIFVDRNAGFENEYCIEALGMESYGIHDSQLTASSTTHDETDKYGPQSGRLNNKYAWRARENSTEGEYIQIDFGEIKNVTAIATQGDEQASSWVTSFSIRYSLDNNTWEKFTQSFKGNVDAITIFMNYYQPIVTRYLQIIPETWSTSIGIRLELYGCFPTCDSQPVGLVDGRISNSQITASSTLRATSQPFNARLGFTQEDSWCAAKDDNNTYLQIDLGVVHVLCAIDTQGNSKADEIVTSFTLQTSRNGLNWTDYEENGKTKIFKTDNGKNFLESNKVVCRFARVLPKSFANAPCMRIELYGVERSTCDKTAVGIGLPNAKVPDSHFKASSVFSKFYAPHKARLLGTHGWEPKDNNDNNDYLMIDLGDFYSLCSMAIQPSGQTLDERATSYKILFSTDGLAFTLYPETLPGYKKPKSHYPTEYIVKNNFAEIQFARFIKIQPLTYYNWKCFRTELYGLKQGWRIKSSGIDANNKPDFQLSALNYHNDDHKPEYALLYNSKNWRPGNGSRDFLQVDLVAGKHVKGVAVQGDEDDSHWVTKMYLEYGYTTDDLIQTENITTGLANEDDISIYWFPSPITARFIRFYPVEWDGAPGMRVDVLVSEIATWPTISEFTTHGKLTPQYGSNITVNCTTPEIYTVDIKWFLGGIEVTSKSQGMSIIQENTTSQIQVNFTSDADVKYRYNCHKGKNYRLKCTTNITCLVVRRDVVGEKKDHLIELLLDRHIKFGMEKHEVVHNSTSSIGSFITMECIVSGRNTTNIHWLINGFNSTNQSSGVINSNEKLSSQLQLNFTLSSVSDKLYYCEKVEGFLIHCNTTVTCLADSENGTKVSRDMEFSTYLVRQLKLSSLRTIQENITRENNTFIVECVAVGDNDTNIHWHIGGRDVTNRAYNRSVIDDQVTGYLFINYTSLSAEENSDCDISCEMVDEHRRCTTEVTCLVSRENVIHVKKEISLEIIEEVFVYQDVDHYGLIVSIVVTSSVIGCTVLFVIGFIFGLCC